jgi:hypothetical protein
MKKLFKIHGFTLSEMMIASAVSIVLVGIGLIASISIQRSFDASIRYANSQSEQVRVLDYLALDLRRALNVTSANGQLTITIPDFYDAAGEPRMPAIVNALPKYGGNPITVRYFRNGARVLRESDGVATPIAENVQDFQFAFQDFGQVIEAAITFVPTFRRDGRQDASRSGTRAVIRVLLRNRRST